MKRFVPLTLVAALAVSLVSCATTPQERARLDRARAKRDADDRRRDREADRHDESRDAEDYQDYLHGYARDLGKSVSELTARERAEARREYNDRGYRRGYYGHPGWGWGW